MTNPVRLAKYVKDDGAFCKYCVLFAANHDSRITNFGALVNQPLINWQKAKVKLNSHFHNTKYHALSLEIASNFIDTLSGKTPPISHQLESIRAQKVHDNKKKLCSIVDCYYLCKAGHFILRPS